MTDTQDGHLPIEMRVATEEYRIARIAGSGKRLVVSLSGVGKNRRFFPPWEFIGTASDGGKNHVLLASDRSRSWMNDATLAERLVEEIETITHQHGIEEVVALGNSMGGFMALVLPDLTKVDRVVATSPQYSMHPDVVPEDTRWGYWRQRMPAFRHERIAALDTRKRDYFILHGSTLNEKSHWARFPYSPKLHHYILMGKGHSVVIAMKGAGLMRGVLHNAIEGRPEEAIRVLSERFKPVRRTDMPLQDAILTGRKQA